MVNLRPLLRFVTLVGLLVFATAAHAQSRGADEQFNPRRFPSVDLSPLNASQQRSFMEIVDAELCPCEDSVKSLGECLEERRGTCGLAREATTRIAQGLLRGESTPAISRGVADLIRQAATPHVFSLEETPSKGAAQPTVTMVSFADFECPYCRELARITDDLLKHYPNDLRVHFMNFPLSGHRHATDAAIAALAAHFQGKFWEFHDRIFANQAALSQSMDGMPLFLRWAEELDLDMERFRRDIDDPRTYDRVQAERQIAMNAGAKGTPTIYLNGVHLLDIDSMAVIRAKIEALIEEAKK